MSDTPHILDSENDPRILRAVAKMLNSEVVRLNALIKKINSEQAKASQQKIDLEESLKIIRKKLYGYLPVVRDPKRDEFSKRTKIRWFELAVILFYQKFIKLK
jgi:predicted  nucleic acid-binding Zn-ribbon protein